MMIDMLALVLMVVISIVIPLVIWITVWVKNPMERKGIILLFLSGVLIYAAMQWGVKEHGLSYLFNHTDLSDIMDQRYITYLLLVAFAGAVLFIIPELAAAFVWKRKMSFVKTAVLGLGYATAEAVMNTGYRSILALIEFSKDSGLELSVPTTELFLSSYERMLIMINQIAITVVLVYFIRQEMAMRGIGIALLWSTLVTFLPGFFIAFTYKDYFEVYDRFVALILVYITLTASAFLGCVVLNSLKYTLRDETMDSPQAMAAYRKKMKK